jgi:integrase
VPPYSKKQIEGLWVWAYGQPRDADRRDAITLLAGCLGAGLTGRELCDLRVRHVHIDDDGVVLDVSGARARQVPVLSEMRRHFVTVTNDADPDAFLFRPRRNVTSKNTASNFIGRCAPSGLPLSTQRTRVTWLVGHLRRGVPINALMKAMGIDDFSAIARYLEHVPDLPEDAYRSALHGDGSDA